MKPVRLPASATITLPRWGLISLCLLYILPGIFGRDPWKTDDAAGFGIMWTMANGTLFDWLFPNIQGLPMPNEAPLAYWTGAMLIKAFNWLIEDHLAAKISTLFFFAIGLVSIWHTAFLYGSRFEAQPLKLAFGGQPAAADYSRALADGALLIYVACLGLLLRSHETAVPALYVALVGAVFYSSAKIFHEKTIKASIFLGINLSLLGLTKNLLLPTFLLLSFIFLAAFKYRSLLRLIIFITIPISFSFSAIWLLSQYFFLENESIFLKYLLISNLKIINWPNLDNIYFFLKTAVWYTWPAWPIAAWAIYAWRRQNALHILLPIFGIFSILLLIFVTKNPKDIDLLPLIPPLAILATFGLSTLKRGAINAIDWFAVMTFSSLALFIWLGWIAQQTGWPKDLINNFYRLAPGFKPEMNLIALIVASLTTFGWLQLLRWRLGRRPSVIWRAVVLSTGGLVLCWVLLMTLWLSWLNYGQSYAPVAIEIKNKMPINYKCVDTINLGPGQRASFAYLGNIEFSKARVKKIINDCKLTLVQDNGLKRRSNKLIEVDQKYIEIWRGRRPSDKNELFRLFLKD